MTFGENELVVGGFVAFTLAIVLLFVGKSTVDRSAILRRYSIPDSVIGGFLAATLVSVLYFGLGYQVSFEIEQVRDVLLLYFFAGIGLRARVRDLVSGGVPLLILVVLAGSFIVLQNLVGCGVAVAFGQDYRVGLMVGSVSLTGGFGTAAAWAPILSDEYGITHAAELGIAASTLGLIAACLTGGPIANYLLKTHTIATPQDSDLEVGQLHTDQHVMLDAYCVLWAWLWLNLALILGYFIDKGLGATGVQMPLFVSCLLAGILISNVFRHFVLRLTWTGEKQAAAMISDLTLGMFLVMALMGLQLWQLQGAVLFLTVVTFLQVLMSVLFVVFVVFWAMGKDYEAAVIASGFTGVNLGTTAVAIVNMTAVTKQFGAAHRAFLLMPLLGGFFVDIMNAVVIGFFVNLGGPPSPP